jgi:hypothetical protein
VLPICRSLRATGSDRSTDGGAGGHSLARHARHPGALARHRTPGHVSGREIIAGIDFAGPWPDRRLVIGPEHDHDESDSEEQRADASNPQNRVPHRQKLQFVLVAIPRILPIPQIRQRGLTALRGLASTAGESTCSAEVRANKRLTSSTDNRLVKAESVALRDFHVRGTRIAGGCAKMRRILVGKRGCFGMSGT